MQIRFLGKPPEDPHPFSWDQFLESPPKPWYRKVLLPLLTAFLLPFLSGSSHSRSSSFGLGLTDQELWTQRLAFIQSALHRAPSPGTLSTFQRLWKLGLRQGEGGGEGIFFSLLYLASCWKKGGFPTPPLLVRPPKERFPEAHRFARFLGRLEE